MHQTNDQLSYSVLLDPGIIKLSNQADGQREDDPTVESSSSKNDVIIQINLSQVNQPSTLPESVKLHGESSSKYRLFSVYDSDSFSIAEEAFRKPPEETLEVIVRPAGGGKMPLGMTSTQGKALWRKREVVKQERSVHYTTIDDEGGLQVCSSDCLP